MLLRRQPGICVVIYLIIQFSQFLVRCLRSDPGWHISGVSPGAHKLLCGVGSSFPLSLVSLVLSRVSHFGSFNQKSWNLLSLLSVLTSTTILKNSACFILFHFISSAWESTFLYSVWLILIFQVLASHHLILKAFPYCHIIYVDPFSLGPSIVYSYICICLLI